MMTRNKELSYAVAFQVIAAKRYRIAERRRADYADALSKGDLLLAAFHLKSWETNRAAAERCYKRARMIMGV